jgi:hypothetical protein
MMLKISAAEAEQRREERHELRVVRRRVRRRLHGVGRAERG